jgi:uncharacterized UPF0160 family protein
MKKLVTHGQGFHADDVVAYAILKEVLSRRGETWTLERTRDEQLIQEADIVFDVGNVYDPETSRYDHHQRGKAGKRANGIEYASVGLIWKHFGMELCSSQEVWNEIDQAIICHIDASDNGQDFISGYHFENVRSISLGQMIGNFRIQSRDNPKDQDPQVLEGHFEQASEFAREVLVRALVYYENLENSFNQILQTYESSLDKVAPIFDYDYGRPTLKRLAGLPEIIFAIYPKMEGGMWKVEAIPKDLGTSESRKYAPEAWWGLRGSDLQQITGVPDATFCHPSGFLFGAVSQEGALELAKKALLMTLWPLSITYKFISRPAKVATAWFVGVLKKENPCQVQEVAMVAKAAMSMPLPFLMSDFWTTIATPKNFKLLTANRVQILDAREKMARILSCNFLWEVF